MLLFLFLLLSFLQVGFLGIGGNASAQALLEHEVITLHHWLTPGQMADLMAFCRILPGGTGINTAILASTLAASSQFGFLGTLSASIVSLVGLAVPSTIWTAFYTTLQEKEQYKRFFDCAMVVLRPLVPGLIAAAAIMLIRTDTFGSPSTDMWEVGISAFLFIATLIGVGYYRINALFMIVLCGLAGCLLY